LVVFGAVVAPWSAQTAQALTASDPDPSSGPTFGGQTVTINGSGFITDDITATYNSGSGTFTVPNGTTSMQAKVWGGGGRGGNGSAGSASGFRWYCRGGGGGAGGYTTRTWANPTAGSSLTFSVGGAGGLAGVGSNGGTSTAQYSSNTLTANGGAVGGSSSGGSVTTTGGVTCSAAAGGSGGTASGGTTNTTGGAGGNYGGHTNALYNIYASAGAGGNSPNGGAGGAGAYGRLGCSGSSCSYVGSGAGSGAAPGGGGGGGHTNDQSFGGSGRVEITVSVLKTTPPTVLFGTEPADCTVVSDTELTCTTPPNPAGTVAVTVDSVSAGTYTYIYWGVNKHYLAANQSGQTFTFGGSGFMTQISGGEFQEIEYITLSGTQYINMGMNAAGNTKVTVDYQNTSFGGWMLLFGARGSGSCNNSMWFGADGDYNAYSYAYGSSSCAYQENLFTSSFNTTSRHTVAVNNNTVSVDGATAVALANNVPTTTPVMFLGAMSENGTPYASMFKGQIYSASVDKDGDADDRNFVPVKCNMTGGCSSTTNTGTAATYGEYGLYDTLHDVFYKAGAGTLSGGPAVAAGTLWPTPVMGGETVTDITIDGVSVGFTVNSPTEITVTAPNHSVTTTPLDVEVIGDSYAVTLSGAEGVNFVDLTAPSPAEGDIAGGTVVTFSGSGFSELDTSNITASFGGTTASNITIIDDNTITVETPASPLGYCSDKTHTDASSCASASETWTSSGGLGLVDVELGLDSEVVGFDDGFEYILASYIKIMSDKAAATVNVSPTWGGATASDHLTVTTETNWSKGFTLEIAESGSGSSLTCGSGASLGTTLPVTTDNVTTIDLNRWAVGVGTASSEPTLWRSVSAVPWDLDSLGTAGSKTTHIYYGARLDYMQPACADYSGSVTITAAVVP
jgi:hypothetical protein